MSDAALFQQVAAGVLLAGHTVGACVLAQCVRATTDVEEDLHDPIAPRMLFMICRIHDQPLTIDAMTDGGTFSIIDELPPHEFVIGHATAGRTAIALADGDHFRSLEPPKGLKIAWNFRTEMLGDGHTRLHTETRTRCCGRGTRAIFRGYWTVIRPFSGYIRKEMLKAARVGADSGASSESPEAGATT